MAWEQIQRDRSVAALHEAYAAALEVLTAEEAPDVDPALWSLVMAAGDVGRQLEPEWSWPAAWPQG